MIRCDDGARGIVGHFAREHIYFNIREEISVITQHIFAWIFIKITNPNGKKHTLLWLIYRPNTQPRDAIDICLSTLFEIIDIINTQNTLSRAIWIKSYYNCDHILSHLAILTIYFAMEIKLNGTMKSLYFRNSLEGNMYYINKTWTILK